jgi:hypothetical protein
MTGFWFIRRNNFSANAGWLCRDEFVFAWREIPAHGRRSGNAVGRVWHMQIRFQNLTLPEDCS